MKPRVTLDLVNKKRVDNQGKKNFEEELLLNNNDVT